MKCFEDCLIESLQELLTEQFDNETKKAWLRFNTFIYDLFEIGMKTVENENEKRNDLKKN